MSERVTTEEQAAIAIYVVSARDVCDALEMIAACESEPTLDALHKMLTAPGSAKTDVGLNAIIAPIVGQRLAAVRAATRMS